jgi:hypothetical protein
MIFAMVSFTYSSLLCLYLEEGVLRLMDEQTGRHPPIKPEERRGRPEAVHSQNLKKGY